MRKVKFPRPSCEYPIDFPLMLPYIYSNPTITWLHNRTVYPLEFSTHSSSLKNVPFLVLFLNCFFSWTIYFHCSYDARQYRKLKTVFRVLNLATSILVACMACSLCGGFVRIWNATSMARNFKNTKTVYDAVWLTGRSQYPNGVSSSVTQLSMLKSFVWYHDIVSQQIHKLQIMPPISVHLQVYCLCLF